MISFLGLVNFKCFKSIRLELGAINVLAGMNGAGKSTIIQSLLAIRQSWESGSIAGCRIQLSGALTDLGTSGEVYCADPVSDAIELWIGGSDGTQPLRFVCPQDKKRFQDYFLLFESAPDSPVEGTAGGLFSDPFNYLHAERIGARKVFGISPDEQRPFRVGKFGENAPYIIGSPKRETLVQNEALILASEDGKEYPTVQYQWALWMARLFPGFEGESEIYSRADQVRLGLALQRQSTGQSIFVRPTNTGFGLSYVLGVLVAGLVARPDTLVIVENPEAHLHPRAQSALGEFLARASLGGAQVIVETHSEHVINGIRRMVRQGVVSGNQVRFLFFSKRAHDIEPSVTSINVLPNGDISEWPEGFLDQLDNDLSIILS
jgi:predicted ATPase